VEREIAGPPFGELLRAYRLNAKLSQEQLAQRSEISAVAIGAIEQGSRRAPYRRTVDLLAAALMLSDAERSVFEAAAAQGRANSLRTRADGANVLEYNFPQSLTPFVKRDDVDQIATLLARHRLLTISGSGGVGKTRTIAEAASVFARAQQRPVWFVDLSAIDSGNVVVEQISSALRIQVPRADESNESLAAELEEREMTVILDNCEHVLADVVRAVVAILSRCPDISFAVTSREALGLSYEVVYRLPSLRIPQNGVASLEEARSYSAVALLLQRAYFADTRFVAPNIRNLPAIIEICRRLDGIPLAIELAAARLPAMGIESLRNRLTEAFVLAGGRDLPERHQTMTATIFWSFDLLDHSEKKLLERICIFVGGFSINAAEMVCYDDSVPVDQILTLLGRLAAKSLLNVVHGSDATRYALLETIRSFGLQRLRSHGEHSKFALRHAEWLAQEGDALSVYQIGARPMVAEFDNVRSALSWCLDSGEQPNVVLAARIISGIRRGWELVGRLMELRRLVADVLAKLDDTEQSYAIIARLWRARLNTYGSHDPDLIEQTIPYFARAGDDESVAILHAQSAANFAGTGRFAEANDQLLLAARYYEGGAARRSGKLYNNFVLMSAWVRLSQRQLTEARDALIALGESEAYDTREGEDEGARLNLLAEVEFHSGNTADAIALSERALECYGRESVSSQASTVLQNMSCYLIVAGDLEPAERDSLLALKCYENNDFSLDQLGMSISFQHLAAIAALRGHFELAATVLGFVDAHWEGKVLIQPLTVQRSRDILSESLQRGLPPGDIEMLRSVGSELEAVAIFQMLASGVLRDRPDQVPAIVGASDSKTFDNSGL